MATTIKIENGEFDVTPSDHPGFISVSPNQRYFQYNNGQSYFPIGHNLLWSWNAGGGLVDVSQMAARTERGGRQLRPTADRRSLVHWAGMEQPGGRLSRVAGRGRPARHDPRHGGGVRHLAASVVLWHQALINYRGCRSSSRTIRRARIPAPTGTTTATTSATADPLSGPALFFSDERAKALFRQRLRYIAGALGLQPAGFRLGDDRRNRPHDQLQPGGRVGVAARHGGLSCARSIRDVT